MSSIEHFAKAIEEDDLDQVESLLARGSIDVNVRLPRWLNPPPLVLAAKGPQSRTAIVTMLLGAGAHIDGTDDDGRTASFVATLCRNVPVLALLLAHRPNLEKRHAWFEKTPLQFSLEVGHLNDYMSTMLINAGASLDLDRARVRALLKFVSRSTSAIQALINRGFDVSQLRDRERCTPLHLMRPAKESAAAIATAEAASMLINVCGVDLEARNVDGCTCTFTAVENGDDVTLRCFIRAGADVNCVDRRGQTPLHLASDYKCAILLVAAGANVSARDKCGETALHIAARHHFYSVLPAFVAADADPGDVNRRDIIVTDIDADQVETARREIARERLAFVRGRAMEICIGLQSLRLDALQMCEILQHSCGPLAPLIAFHQWWRMATTVKHFRAN
jgi:ankyrin repeat protein